MRLDVVTIFPEYLEPLRHALLGKAIESGIMQVGVHNLRQWASGVHQAVDDSPYGGGPGMVMKPDVWGPALDDVLHRSGPAADTEDLGSAVPHVRGMADAAAMSTCECTVGEDAPEGTADTRPLLIVPTPAGTPFTQEMAQRWAKEERIGFACGRYEGIDQRVVDDAALKWRVEEVSIGDYVLVGGEVAVLVMAEAIVRLIPGVLGNKRSHEEDSFSDGLLEGPSYTKPRTWRNFDAPAVLLSGDHGKVDMWRRRQSLLRTARRRPELLDHAEFSAADQAFVDSLRTATTDLSILISPQDWAAAVPKIHSELTAQHQLMDLDVQVQHNFCETDNMLMDQYMATHESAPLHEQLHLVKLQVYGPPLPVTVTKLITDLLPEGTNWYGTTVGD